MPIPLEAYTAGGTIRGVVARAGRLRDMLETDQAILVERCRRSDGEPLSDEMFAVDDLLVVPFADESPPVHASWHSVQLEVGPYVVEGELPTLPGYDPGRALARPSGTYVLLRDVHVWVAGAPSVAAKHPFALINRYAVDRISADLMLGFFFPGARLDVAPAGGSAATA